MRKEEQLQRLPKKSLRQGAQAVLPGEASSGEPFAHMAKMVLQLLEVAVAPHDLGGCITCSTDTRINILFFW